MKRDRPCVLRSQPAQLSESDCACAVPDVDSRETRDTSALTWQRVQGLYHASLPADHTLAFNPQRPEVLTVLDPAASQLLDRFAQPIALQNVGAYSPAGASVGTITAAHQLAMAGLITPAPDPRSETRHAPSAIHRSLLTAWLHLTTACNLACAYCYVAKSNANMDESTGRAAVEAVFRSAVRHGYRAVKLKYAGGEPTLNFGLIRSLHRHAQGLAAQHGLILHEVVLSNGTTLTSKMLDFLKLANIQIMISLDGLGMAHDQQRPLTSGHASSGLVLAGLERALTHGLTPHVSVTVSPASAAGLAETTDYLLKRDLPFNWNFVRDTQPPEQDWQNRLITHILAAVTVIEAHLPQRRLIDGLLDRISFAGAHSYACGAGHDYVAIDQCGQVARCHMALNQPASDIWADDLLGAVRTAGTVPHILSVEDREGCQKCVWRYVCAGGCPFLSPRTIGSGTGRSPYCDVYRTILPEILRLEGLRMLKWQTALPA